MKIIVGCGKVGTSLAERLSVEDHDLVMVDLSEQKVEEVSNRYDAMGIVGSRPVLKCGLGVSCCFYYSAWALKKRKKLARLLVSCCGHQLRHDAAKFICNLNCLMRSLLNVEGDSLMSTPWRPILFICQAAIPITYSFQPSFVTYMSPTSYGLISGMDLKYHFTNSDWSYTREAIPNTVIKCRPRYSVDTDTVQQFI